MHTATISKKITKGEELVVMPRQVYDQFLIAYEQCEKYGKSARELEADADIASGRVSRGYRTKTELKSALNRLKR